ncbi:MAG: helix-turn-helix transcriptional regulator [Treponema sp.]|nr:helix-turn-helix transcriptional regulator [Treponema sp.]
MSFQRDFIENLKYYRSLKGYSQAKLAELCQCQPATIGCIECARQFPSFDLLFKISTALEIHPADLFLRNASKSTLNTRKIMSTDFISYVSKFVEENF